MTLKLDFKVKIVNTTEHHAAFATGELFVNTEFSWEFIGDQSERGA